MVYIRDLLAWLITIVFVVACIRNVFYDTHMLQAKAQHVACNEKNNCNLQLVQIMRTPISSEYSFSNLKETHTVTCRRDFIFYGEYECVK